MARSLCMIFECEIDELPKSAALRFVNNMPNLTEWALRLSMSNKLQGLIRLNKKTSHSVIERRIRQYLRIGESVDIRYNCGGRFAMSLFFSLTKPKPDTKWIVCSRTVPGARKRRRADQAELRDEDEFRWYEAEDAADHHHVPGPPPPSTETGATTTTTTTTTVRTTTTPAKATSEDADDSSGTSDSESSYIFDDETSDDGTSDDDNSGDSSDEESSGSSDDDSRGTSDHESVPAPASSDSSSDAKVTITVAGERVVVQVMSCPHCGKVSK